MAILEDRIDTAWGNIKSDVKRKGELTNAMDIDGKIIWLRRGKGGGIELACVAYGIQSFSV